MAADPLLKTLASMGALDATTVGWARTSLVQDDVPLDTALLRLDLVGEEPLLRALSACHGMTRASRHDLLMADPAVSAVLSLDEARTMGIAPLHEEAQILVVLTSRPLETEAIEWLRTVRGVEVEQLLAPHHYLELALASVYDIELDDAVWDVEERLQRRRKNGNLSNVLQRLERAEGLHAAASEVLRAAGALVDFCAFLLHDGDRIRVIAYSGEAAHLREPLTTPPSGSALAAAIAHQGYYFGLLSGTAPEQAFYEWLGRDLAAWAYVAPVPAAPGVLFYGDNADRAIPQRWVAELTLLVARLGQHPGDWREPFPEPAVRRLSLPHVVRDAAFDEGHGRPESDMADATHGAPPHAEDPSLTDAVATNADSSASSAVNTDASVADTDASAMNAVASPLDTDATAGAHIRSTNPAAASGGALPDASFWGVEHPAQDEPEHASAMPSAAVPSAAVPSAAVPPAAVPPAAVPSAPPNDASAERALAEVDEAPALTGAEHSTGRARTLAAEQQGQDEHVSAPTPHAELSAPPPPRRAPVPSAAPAAAPPPSAAPELPASVSLEAGLADAVPGTTSLTALAAASPIASLTRGEAQALAKLRVAADEHGLSVLAFVDKFLGSIAAIAPAPTEETNNGLAGEIKGLFEKLAADIPAHFAKGMESAFRDLVPRATAAPKGPSDASLDLSAPVDGGIVMSEAKPREVENYRARRRKASIVKP